MGASDFVQVQVSISNANSPSVQGLTTPLIATFHTHFSDRVRIYSASPMLTQMPRIRTARRPSLSATAPLPADRRGVES